MVVHRPSKPETGVRFPSPAPLFLRETRIKVINKEFLFKKAQSLKEFIETLSIPELLLLFASLALLFLVIWKALWP